MTVIPKSWTKPTVWTEFNQLANASPNIVNLGQGFPDWQPPDFVQQQAIQAIQQGFNQYTRPAGHPPLVNTLAQRYTTHLGQDINPLTQVAITVGASQALYLTLQSILTPQDKVLLLEPAFDLYYKQVQLTGATVTPVPLTFQNQTFTLDPSALEQAITPQTKVLILNSPHNPTGKVFSRKELEDIAHILRKHPHVICISDEVYKYIVHCPRATHVHFASLPDMFERTITLSSAGKTFSITGWQIGWCLGPEKLIQPIQALLPCVQFCAATPMQQALANILNIADEPYQGCQSYYEYLQQVYRRKKKILVDAIQPAGLTPIQSQGGFFPMADTTHFRETVPTHFTTQNTPAAPHMTPDWALARYLAIEKNLVAIPASPFYSERNKHLAQAQLRLAFCKSDDTLAQAKVALAHKKAQR